MNDEQKITDFQRALERALAIETRPNRGLHVLRDMPITKALEQLGFDFRDGRLHAPGLSGTESEVVVTSRVDPLDEVKFDVKIVGVDPNDLVEIIERIYQARNKTNGEHNPG